MGEYIKNVKTGEEIKVGVLDHCFFSRGQIERWALNPDITGWYAGKPEENTLENFLNDPKTLYDGVEGLIHKDFAIKVYFEPPEYIDHREVTVYQKGKRGSAYHFKVQCQFKGQGEVWASIVGERYNKKGEGRTIFACDCCGTLFSLYQSTLDRTLEAADQKQREYLKPILKAVKESE